MSGIEVVRQAVIRCLQAGGMEALGAYDREKAAESGRTVVAVGIRGCAAAESGVGCYLGEAYDEKTASWQERYGRELTLTVALDAYAPVRAGAAGCCAALEKAHDLLTAGGVAGLRPEEMDWGEARFDRETDLFLQQGNLRCRAFLVATVAEESGMLLEIRLKGVPLL